MPSRNRVRGEVPSQGSTPDKSSPSVSATATVSKPVYEPDKLEALKKEIGFRVSGDAPADDLARESLEYEIEDQDLKQRYKEQSESEDTTPIDKQLELSKGFKHLTPGEQFAEIAGKLKTAKNFHAKSAERQAKGLEKARKELPFDPYLAITTAGGECHVDEDYLREHLDWQPNVNYAASNTWKPRKIKPFDQSNRLSFDIETLGSTPLDPACRFIMAFFITEGPFKNITDERVRVALEQGFHLVLKSNTDDAERDLITQTFKLIHIIGPEIISAHNGLAFDFSFLYDRAQLLGVPCPIDIDRSRVRYVTSGTDYKGMAPAYFKTYFTHRNYNGYFYNDGSFPQILDTLIAATIDNKVRSNYKSFSLKRLITDHFKVRAEKRLELSYEEILANWDRWINGGDQESLDRLVEYGYEDVKDQKALTNIYGNLIWAQQSFFPMAFQDLLLGSPALKWNKLLQNFYKPYNSRVLPNAVAYIDPQREIQERGIDPAARIRYVFPENGSQTFKYKGGKVDATPCIKSNFFKIDVSSLYPSLMLRYALYDKVKDPLCVMLTALATARKFRYVLKPLGNGDPDTARKQPAYLEDPDTFAAYFAGSKMSNKGADGSMKVVINGCYGFVGVGGYNFNSPKTAALVTAYGRIIMGKMMSRAFTLSTMVNLDTDGITASPKPASDEVVQKFFNDNKDLKYFDKNGVEIPKFSKASGTNCVNAEWVYQYTQEGLPTDIVIDLETNYPKGVIISYKAKNYAYYYHSHTFIPAMKNAVKFFGKTTYASADDIVFSPYTTSQYIEQYGPKGELADCFDEIADGDGNIISPFVDVYDDDSVDGRDPVQLINPEYIIADAELYLPEWMFLNWKWVYNKKTKRNDAIKIGYELTLDEDDPEVLEWMYPKTFDEVEPDEALGMFTKRNFSKFKKSYMTEYGRRVGFFGEECAVDYHDHIDRKLQGLSEKHPSDLTQKDLEWLTIKRKISTNEVKIVRMGVGNQGDVVTYYFGDYIELSKSTGKPVKKGVEQPFYVRVHRGEWDELRADPPSLDYIDNEFTAEANKLNLSVSYKTYAAELLELTDNMNKVAFGRMTSAEKIAEERRRITLEKANTKNTKRIEAIKLEEKPYARLLSLVKSGGQCGADRAGIDAAASIGLATGGEATKGYLTMTSDGELGDDISLKRMGLTENRSEKFGPRTRVNAQKSDATVWFGSTESPGYRKTYEYIVQYNKPHILNPSAEELAAFVLDHWIETLNVAGNRISRAEKLALEEGIRRGDTIYEITYDICVEAFNIIKDMADDPLDESSEKLSPVGITENTTSDTKDDPQPVQNQMPLVFGL